ncbi:hypothetical protein K435DRAFT_680749, partial [Dendrothele bispora CBS 962.96]
YTVHPFNEAELRDASERDRRRMKAFNFKLSSICIHVEHASGALKGRFASLRCIGAHLDIREVYAVIEALIILHNMCLYYRDEPEQIMSAILLDSALLRDDNENNGFDSVHIEGEAFLPAHETEDWLREAGFLVRK